MTPATDEKYRIDILKNNVIQYLTVEGHAYKIGIFS